MRTINDITIILDRSGSMESIKEATIKGYNSFLKEHKALDSKTNITLIQFDDEYKIVYQGKNIKDVNYLNDKTFQPRGTTALLDAIGITISDNRKRFKQMEASIKPKNIIVAIITDGEENASRDFTQKQVFTKINNRKQKDNWTFVFLAANQDAIVEGAKFGISDNLCLSMKASEKGVEYAFRSFIKQSKAMIVTDNYKPKFSKTDRDKQLN